MAAGSWSLMAEVLMILMMESGQIKPGANYFGGSLMLMFLWTTRPFGPHGTGCRGLVMVDGSDSFAQVGLAPGVCR